MGDMQLQKLFAKRLREIRRDQGLSQEDLSEKSGIHERTISFIERGLGSVKLDTIAKLAKGLQVEPVSFFLYAQGHNIDLKDEMIVLSATMSKKNLESAIDFIKAIKKRD